MAFVNVAVAIRALRKLGFVLRLQTGRLVTLGALDAHVPPLQRVPRLRMFNKSESCRLPAVHMVT